MNEVDHWVLALLKQQKEWPEQGFDPDLCDAGAVLYQLNYQANWKEVTLRVDYKPVDR